MLRWPTVVLRHETRGGTHYDWLMGDPTLASDPAAGLWTARTPVPPTAWRAARVWPLEQLGRHRRAYLTYQGAISGGRGCVRRVASGWIVPRVWTPACIVCDLTMSDIIEDGHATVRLHRFDAARWRATWVS
jgi:hypothetical protein